jgi:hypothetical protein
MPAPIIITDFELTGTGFLDGVDVGLFTGIGVLALIGLLEGILLDGRDVVIPGEGRLVGEFHQFTWF